jgi:predicted kinase
VARLVLLCGMPGAGKTTVAPALAAAHGALHLCPDEWFGRLGLDPHDAGRRAAFEDLQWQQALQLLALGTSVVVESGSWRQQTREVHRLGARALGVDVELHVLDVPLEERWRRVQRRNYERGSVAITRAQLEQFERLWEPPTQQERALYDPPLHPVA